MQQVLIYLWFRVFLSSYKHVRILPISKIIAQSLFIAIKRVVVLENVGFKVICVSSDNNAINGKAMSYFANPPKLSILYKHPCCIGNEERPLFFIFDPVHILKCIKQLVKPEKFW